MRHTFEIKPGNLNANFVKSMLSVFGDKEIKIVIEDVDRKPPVSQRELYEKSLPVIERFKNVKIDPRLV